MTNQMAEYPRSNTDGMYQFYPTSYGEEEVETTTIVTEKQYDAEGRVTKETTTKTRVIKRPRYTYQPTWTINS